MLKNIISVNDYQLYKNLNEDMLDAFSKFKYGCKKSTSYFARLFVKNLSDDVSEGNTYFASTFFTQAKSASHWLALDVKNKLNDKLAKSGLPATHYFEMIQSVKKPIFEDYSKLSIEDRKKSQEVASRILTTPNFTDKDFIIIINDLYMTGAQYFRQKNLLEGMNMRNLTWLYLYRIFNSDSTVENLMNNYHFKTDIDFAEFVICESHLQNLYPTKRTLLRILTSPKDIVQKIASEADEKFKKMLFNDALGENMHLAKALSDNFESLFND